MTIVSIVHNRTAALAAAAAVPLTGGVIGAGCFPLGESALLEGVVGVVQN